MTVSFLAVFAAGLLTALSPCVLPLAPILVGGLVATDHASRWARLRATAWFTLGFAAVFAILGLGASSIVRVVHPLRPALLTAAAVTIGLYGLRMMGLVGAGRRLAWMERTIGPAARPARDSDRPRALLLGAVFGLTWTPCAGPMLGAVLTYVAADDTPVVLGAPLLVAYAAGVATPLLLVAAASEYATPLLRRLGRHVGRIERASGAALVALGILVLAQIASGPRLPAPPRGPSSGPRTAGVELRFFHSEHCPTCRAMESYLPEIERDCASDRWALTRVDVDARENATAVADANVRAVPTVTLRAADGHEVLRLVGYRTEAQLRSVLERDALEPCAAADDDMPVEPDLLDHLACDVGRAC